MKNKEMIAWFIGCIIASVFAALMDISPYLLPIAYAINYWWVKNVMS